MVRHPCEAIPSAISWVSYGFYQFNTADQAVVTEMILSLISHFYTYPLAELDKRPEDSRIIAVYDSLVSDPAAFIEFVYDRFGFSVTPPYRRTLNQQTEKTKEYKSKHAYSLEQYGLTPDQVAQDFKPVFDRFGFKSLNSG
jgi:hypothetical protein